MPSWRSTAACCARWRSSEAIDAWAPNEETGAAVGARQGARADAAQRRQVRRSAGHDDHALAHRRHCARQGHRFVEAPSPDGLTGRGAASSEAPFRHPPFIAAAVAHPRPAIQRPNDDYRFTGAHAQLDCRVVFGHQRRGASAAQQRLWHPARTAIGAPAPFPAWVHFIFVPDLDSGSRGDPNGVRVRGAVSSNHYRA